MTSKPVPSFTAAIYELLGRLGDALKARGAPDQSIRAYIFGGCAVHMYSATRVSSDLDLEVHTALFSSKDLFEAKQEAGYVVVQKSDEDEPAMSQIWLNV